MVMERETGFEPATFCLGSRYSTTELLPRLWLDGFNITSRPIASQGGCPVAQPLRCGCARLASPGEDIARSLVVLFGRRIASAIPPSLLASTPFARRRIRSECR